MLKMGRRVPRNLKMRVSFYVSISRTREIMKLAFAFFSAYRLRWGMYKRFSIQKKARHCCEIYNLFIPWVEVDSFVFFEFIINCVLVFLVWCVRI